MTATNQYLPFAAAGGANVLSPAAYSALAARLSGFSAGIADEFQANTPWRQASVGIAALAQFACDTTGVDMLDDGSVTNFKVGFSGALNFVISAAIDAAGSFGSGAIFGLQLSNTPSFLTTRVSIATGQCRNSLNNANLVLNAPLSKDLTSGWSAGNGNGGRDAGSLANGQTWHMFIILNPTTTAVDALFSQSPTAPTLPTGFTKFRRIGAVMLDAAATTIRAFIQTGDWFMLKLRSTDYAVTSNGGGVAYLRVITVPNGIKVEARMYFQSTGTANTTAYLSGIFDPDFGVPPAFGGSTQWAQVRRAGVLDSTSTAVSYNTVIAAQFTDTSQHIYTFSSDNLDVIALGVLGWRDERGKFF